MMEFIEVLHGLQTTREQFNEMEWKANDSSGIVTIQVYVGIENAKLLNDARVMFEPEN